LRDAVIPTWSVIGGKLTTCRSLAEETAATVLARLGRTMRATSRERLVPGAEAWPGDAALEHAQRRLADRHGCSLEQVAAMWRLCGTRVDEILGTISSEYENLDGTAIPRDFVRWVIHHEWVRTLDDLIERRLLLLYAELLVEAGLLEAAQVDAEVASSIERLKSKFGKHVSWRKAEG
jgi:glycerol-3-phosphate dehydrogenase